MIRKPSGEWGRESAFVTHARGAAGSCATAAKVGTLYIRALACWGLALLWGFAALAGGLLAGSVPTLLGVGAMAALMAWAGSKMFAKARR